MLKKTVREWVGAVAVNFLWVLSCHAEMSYLDLKDVHEMIAPEYRDQLSPVFVYTLLGTDSLAHRRFYGNYGSKKPEHTCLNGTNMGADLAKKNACPQDFNSEWIQKLFPSPDGDIFVANQISSDPFSKLTPEIMGQVLGRLARVQDTDLTDHEKAAKLTLDLEAIFSKEVEQVRSHLNTKLIELNKQKKLQAWNSPTSCTNVSNSDIPQQISDLNKCLEDLKEHGIDSDTLSKHRDGLSEDEKAKKVAFAPIARMLVGALKEARIDSTYPRHLPEQALLAYFLKKYDKKKDFISLFKSMPQVIAQDRKLVLEKGEDQKKFLALRYDRAEFPPIDPNQAPHEIVDTLLKDPGRLILSIKEGLLNGGVKLEFPSILSYGNWPHSSLKNQNPPTFPDCGETALRNFFNIFLYDKKTGHFDASRLNSFPSPKVAEIKKFYEKYPDLEGTKDHPGGKSDQAFTEWGELVSRLKNVSYLKPRSSPQCEINVGVGNMTNVIDQLLFEGAHASLSPLDRLKEFCAKLSRPDFKLTYNMSPEDQKNLEKLEKGERALPAVFAHLNVNGQPSFDWKFDYGPPGHFVITPVNASQKTTLKDKLGEEVLNQMDKSGAEPLLPWLISPMLLPKLPLNPKHPFLRENLIHALPLTNAEERMSALSHILSSTESEAHRMQGLGKALQKRLEAMNDHNMNKRVHIALTEAGYPWNQGPLHPLGKENVSYTRVKPEEIGKKYGSEAEKQMGKLLWSREMFGHPVAIGEPLVDEHGNERKLNFVAAKKACLDLNPLDQRASIEKAFNEREAHLDQVRKDETFNNEEEKEKKLKEIHEKMPIPGIYLMSKEEWKVLEGDFGDQENTYSPQILPKLRNRWFWSSSGVPSSAYHAFYFGAYGEVGTGSRDLDSQVRCGAAAVVK